MKFKNLALIGMPGSGKSLIGKQLATEIGREFIDIDEEIVKKQGKSIKDLFIMGEESFREIEQEVLKEFSLKENLIIATGGGIIKRYENVRELKKNSIIIFIDRPLEDILKDIDTDTRPLLTEGKEKLFKLYEERYQLYILYCDIIIKNDKDVNSAVDKILTQI
ncbi:MAG TPA: shikimate kinase [Clostridiaceae bacterium]